MTAYFFFTHALPDRVAFRLQMFASVEDFIAARWADTLGDAGRAPVHSCGKESGLWYRMHTSLANKPHLLVARLSTPLGVPKLASRPEFYGRVYTHAPIPRWEGTSVLYCCAHARVMHPIDHMLETAGDGDALVEYLETVETLGRIADI